MAEHALVETRTQLSTSPLVGVLAVLLGGSLSTLNGRLLAVALPDVRGGLHLSVDDAAWVSAIYNMALMFIGVFAVYLGAVLGTRRVLMFSCAGYTACSLLVPFASTYSGLLCLQALAGLTSGTFYPLALSFILVSVPTRIAHLALACYSISILFSVNIASSLSGWYLTTLSWRWTFWCLACLGPVMALCIYFGIPWQPLRTPSTGGPSWRGLLYWSFGLAFIYGALDQGERLHWFDSPLYAALLGTGTFLIVASICRRFADPNPFIALPFVRNRSTILLGIALFFFRFYVLSTALLIPGFLSGVLGFRQEQIGPLLIIVACLQFAVAWVAAFSLQGMNSRLLMAIGFAIVGLTAFLCSHLSTAWRPATFTPYAVLLAVGESFAMLGLVGSLVLQVIGTGAVGASGKIQRPFDVLTFSGFFHTVRLMGGEVGAVIMAHILSQRTKFHANVLSQGIHPSSAVVQNRHAAGLSYFHGVSSGPSQALGWIASLLGADLKQQAATMAYADAFTVLAWSCLAILVLIAFIRIRLTDFEELSQ